MDMFLRNGFFEIATMDWSFSQEWLFETNIMDWSIFKGWAFLKSALWICLFLRNVLFEIGIFLCDGPIGMVRYVSEVCQVM